jgi:NDP-sugar pyrophosphorylase family protein
MSRLLVAVLAGRLATRLGPLTQQTPKCVLGVAGGPFITSSASYTARRCARWFSVWTTRDLSASD